MKPELATKIAICAATGAAATFTSAYICHREMARNRARRISTPTTTLNTNEITGNGTQRTVLPRIPAAAQGIVKEPQSAVEKLEFGQNGFSIKIRDENRFTLYDGQNRMGTRKMDFDEIWVGVKNQKFVVTFIKIQDGVRTFRYELVACHSLGSQIEILSSIDDQIDDYLSFLEDGNIQIGEHKVNQHFENVPWWGTKIKFFIQDGAFFVKSGLLTFRFLKNKIDLVTTQIPHGLKTDHTFIGGLLNNKSQLQHTSAQSARSSAKFLSLMDIQYDDDRLFLYFNRWGELDEWLKKANKMLLLMNNGSLVFKFCSDDNSDIVYAIGNGHEKEAKDAKRAWGHYVKERNYLLFGEQGLVYLMKATGSYVIYNFGVNFKHWKDGIQLFENRESGCFLIKLANADKLIQLSMDNEYELIDGESFDT